MKPLRAAALAALLAGLALIAYAVAQGQARVGFFLVFPMVIGSGLLPLLGFLLLMLATFLWFASLVGDVRAHAGAGDGEAYAGPGAPRAEGEWGERRERRVRHGGVVLLGPIPIVWGSDRKVLPWMVLAGLVLLGLALLVTLAGR